MLSPTSILEVPEYEEYQTVALDQIEKYIGENKGIQGHQMSYFDSTIFALFALSNAWDSVFLGTDRRYPPPSKIQRETTEVLWKNIINPLRRYRL